MRIRKWSVMASLTHFDLCELLNQLQMIFDFTSVRLSLGCFVVSASMSISSGRVIIAGGGIHGVSTAYYLAQKGIPSLIVEKSSIAAAASGKAGGFLARGWGSGSTTHLHEKSYDLHKELASELDITSYRQVNTLEVDGNRKGKNVASWLNGKVSSTMMDTQTAQVTPKELTEKMLEAVMALKNPSGDGAMVTVLIDAVTGVATTERAGDGKQVTGVHTRNNGLLETTSFIMSLGPWSGVTVEDWFGLPLPMDGVKSTSLVFAGLKEIEQEPYACFCAEDNNGCHLELYPRPNGELYVCGCGGSDYVSGDRLRDGGDAASAEMVSADPRRVAASCASLRSMTNAISSTQEPDTIQACMRPCTPDALPVMGPIPGIQGAYITCGHNCWGILWAPVCGLAMAELVAEGHSSTVDLRPFSPDRYMLASSGKATARGRKKGQEQVGEQW